MKELSPAKVTIFCLAFLFVFYLTSSLDYALAVAISLAAIVFSFPAERMLIITFVSFGCSLVVGTLGLKTNLVRDLSVTSYLFMVVTVILYFLQGQRKQHQFNLFGWLKFTLPRKGLARTGVFILGLILVLPLIGPVFTVIVGFLSVLFGYKKILDGRYAFAIAALSLAICPIFSAINQNEIAEGAAIFAFYFLVIGLIQQLIAMTINREETSEGMEEFEFKPLFSKGK